LALNAAHATAAGGEIEISDQIMGREWVCLVRDNGVGIAPENVDKIFDPFFTLRTGGTGLGLANVERIIRAHRGRIWVESKIGVGTTFYCALPLARGEYG
jgi:two-component system sensor histidine kinase AtoS